MLVLSRKQGERIVIGSDIRIVVIESRSGVVKLGIEAPPEVPVHREEVQRRIEEVQRRIEHERQQADWNQPVWATPSA